ncbi:uncharacterized protein LOC135383899 [Ornithodoros turicata]|uniref:uncharacterized protein LOC135383899 n=1 Tax=Ornithodoros turicata TaxID=34597 RepID=UPI003139E9A7
MSLALTLTTPHRCKSLPCCSSAASLSSWVSKVTVATAGLEGAQLGGAGGYGGGAQLSAAGLGAGGGYGGAAGGYGGASGGYGGEAGGYGSAAGGQPSFGGAGQSPYSGAFDFTNNVNHADMEPVKPQAVDKAQHKHMELALAPVWALSTEALGLLEATPHPLPWELKEATQEPLAQVMLG